MTAVHDRPVASANIVPILTKVPAWQRGYARRLAAVDMVGVVLAVGLAQWLRFGPLPGTTPTYRYWNYTVVSIAIAVIWLLALSINRSRSPRVIGCGAEEYRRVWLATLTVFGGVAIISMLFKLDIARGYLMIALPTGIVLLILFRWVARRVVVRARQKHGRCITRVLVVGNAPAVRDLTKSFARDPGSEYQVVGACIPGPIIRTKLDVAGPRLQMRPVAGLPLIHVEKPQYNGAKRFEKRLFDVMFSGAVLLCGLPALLAVALAVKLTSKGPIFYRSERIGLDGQAFEMIKFRTMADGADAMVDKLAALNESEGGGLLFKIRSDPRVTPLGRFLRKHSIDELPQFINVLKHDMSVVGPRPPLATEVKTYDDYAKRRLLVRPGITGLWQVSGRSDLSWEDSVRLDLFYVENWSMIADLLIAVKTVKAMFAHSGAY